MRRRDFLSGGAAALGGLALPRTARADVRAFGAPTQECASTVLGPGSRAERCLEIYVFGGLATWESFYVVDAYGRPDDPTPSRQNTMWHLYASEHDETFGRCGLTNPAGWLTPFGRDSNGAQVSLGPLVHALKDRPDIVARMRVVAMRHEFEPHEAAIPLALSGLRLGNPRLAGFGTHVQRYWHDRDTTGRSAPWSYVLSPTTTVTSTAGAVGTHPGSAKPLYLKTGEHMDLTSVIGRQAVGDDVDRVNALLRRYADANVGRHVDADGLPLRSRGVTDHTAAIAALIEAPSLQNILTPSLFAVDEGTQCGLVEPDPSGMSVRAAVELLTHPTTPARYVNVIDGGYAPYMDVPYDTHLEHLEPQTRNHTHLWASLAPRINEPGEGDPTKLDLDDTVICITSEFGRTPYAVGPGTNHFPHGYVSVLIGGPVQAGVSGALGPDGYALDAIGPAELRAGLLASLGIFPYHVDGFAVGDLSESGAYTELEQLLWLHERVLGRST